MKFLSEITLTVCVLSVICTVMMMLVPDRYRRDIRSVVSLIAAIAIIASVLGADFSDIGADFESISFQSGVETRNSLIQSDVEKRLEDYMTSFLAEKGIKCKNIRVRTTIDEQNSIFITEAELLLDSSDKEREPFIRSILAEKIGEIDVKISYGDS